MAAKKKQRKYFIMTEEVDNQGHVSIERRWITSENNFMCALKSQTYILSMERKIVQLSLNVAKCKILNFIELK